MRPQGQSPRNAPTKTLTPRGESWYDVVMTTILIMLIALYLSFRYFAAPKDRI